VAHRRARLTPFGRLLVVQRVELEGWTAAHAAEAAGVSRATVYKWLRRFREEGPAGLEDRSSSPRRCPHALPPSTVREILRARRRLGVGPHRLAPVLGRPRSTVYGVLRRHGLSRLADLDRPTRVPIRRYERARPGELLHVDVKKLGRIRPGGGWRMLGLSTKTKAPRATGAGYDFIHAAVDDHSRVAYVEVHRDERGPTCAGFLTRAGTFFAELGVHVERVMTDNHLSYTRATAFREALTALGARHVVIPVYRPQANGKVERFNRTMLTEWAYARLYRSNEERLQALPAWLDFYNRRRPHTALGGNPPASRL
jgi:transposase InsO family protein